MLNKYGMEGAYGTDSPIGCNMNLETKENEDHSTDHKEYLAIAGSLMYTALEARPDISYAVTSLSRFNINPRTRQQQNVSRDTSSEQNTYGSSIQPET